MIDNLKIKSDLVASYNAMAKERDTLPKGDWKISERETFLSLLRDNNVSRMLEIGAGTGQDGLFFKEHGYDVTCVDMSPAMVTCCIDKGLPAYEMDLMHLNFPENSFDAIWALNCLLHVPKSDMPQVLTGIQRVLRPGGLFYMGVYGRENSEGVWEGDSYSPKRFFSFYDEDSLKTMVSEYFEVIQFKILPHNAHLDFQSVTVRNDK